METTIGEIADFQKGFAFKSKDYQECGVRIVRVTNLNRADYSTENSLFIDEKKSVEYARYALNKNDVVISTVGSWPTNPASVVGKVSIIPGKVDGSLLNQNAVRLRARDVCSQEYLGYMLRDVKFQNYIVGTAQGSASQASITLEDIRRYQVELPEINIQEKRIGILRCIDEKIRINEAINRNLLNQGRALYEDLISSYEVNAKLSDLINSIETGSRPRGGAQESGVPSVGAEKIECFGVYDYSGEKYISEEFFEKLKRGRVLSGDVLLYKDGAYTGKTSMALDGFPHAKCAINEHVYKLNSSDNLFQFFLYFTLDNKKNKDYIYTLASSKAAQPGLNQTELLSVEIVLPDKITLLEFEESVSHMMHLIALNAKENRKLAMLRDSLLPRLMSGELDVSDLDI